MHPVTSTSIVDESSGEIVGFHWKTSQRVVRDLWFISGIDPKTVFETLFSGVVKYGKWTGPAGERRQNYSKSVQGTGTRPDYLANRADLKNEGPLARNSRRLSGGGVGAQGQLTRGANWRSPETKYKRSRIVFAVTSIALTLVSLGAKLLELPAQSVVGSPVTLSLCVAYEEEFSRSFQLIWDSQLGLCKIIL